MRDKTKTITEWLDGGCSSWGVPSDAIASLVEENKRMREALEYAHKGLDMVHNGLMDPTRPRQSVGEVCAHFLDASNKSLGDTNA